jgi:cobalt-zinc-cadmium efflux system protein
MTEVSAFLLLRFELSNGIRINSNEYLGPSACRSGHETFMTHSHSPGATTGRRLGPSIFLTFAFVVAEACAGYFANSLALLSDAGHNFADALTLVFSWYAVRISSRPANARRTFGFHRAGILAALLNAVSLVVLALVILWEAAQRLWTKETVQPGWMIGVALAACGLNALISVWLRGDAKHDLNIRSAYLHMLGDAISSLGVAVAGIVIALTGVTSADAIVSFLIGALILWSSWSVLVEATNVLMESVPKGLDLAHVEKAIREVTGVLNVHDLHVWSLGSGIRACSCHILVAEQSVRSGQQVLKAVVDALNHQFEIGHSTVQVEVEGCDPNDPYCAFRQPAPTDRGGHRHPHE